VTAFVRSPRKITRARERPTVIEDDPRDAGQLSAALPGFFAGDVDFRRARSTKWPDGKLRVT